MLTPESAVLVLVDLQIGHLKAIRTIASSQLVRNAVALTQIAHLFSIPVVMTGARQPPPEGIFLPEILSQLPGQHVIERTTTNAWDTPEFVAAIADTGRQHLLLAGVALEIGVLLPALSAVSAGYSVAVVVDVTGTTDSRVEVGAMLGLSQAGVALTSWAAVGMELQQDLSAPSGFELLNLINSSAGMDTEW